MFPAHSNSANVLKTRLKFRFDLWKHLHSSSGIHYKMGKKRKAGGRASDKAIGRDVDPSNAKLRISTFEDVADSEDEFHLNRDKVLLDDGPDRKRQRRQEEQGSKSGSASSTSVNPAS